MLKQLLIVGFISLIGCSPAVAETVTATITDHYKTVIKQSPYNVEVCRDVSVSGDKSGDMLKGAIIGGIIDLDTLLLCGCALNNGCVVGTI